MSSVKNHNSGKTTQHKTVSALEKPFGPKKTPDPETEDIRELDYLHREIDRDVNKAVQKPKRGFFGRMRDSVKRLFGFTTKRTKESVEREKFYIDKPGPKNIHTPKVLIYDGFVDMEFIEKNINKYIFLISGNLKQSGGKYGQSAILRPAKEAYPEAIVELPVTRAHANVMDPVTLQEVSYRETSPEEVAENVQHLDAAINDVIKRSSFTGKTILMLKGGYGTGGARMFAFAPKTFKAMNKLLEEKLGVRNMLDPISAKYSLEYVTETKAEPNPIVASDDAFSPEAISKDLWSNGWALTSQK